MPDLGRDVRAFRNRERLVERFVDRAALRPQVREVDAPVTGRHLGHLDEVVGRVEAIGHVLERRTEAEGAVLHGLGDQGLHALQRGWRRRHVVGADDVVPHAAGADKRPDVDRRPAAGLQPREVPGEGPEVLDDLEVVPVRLALCDHSIVRGRNRLAFSRDLGRDALHDLRRGAAVHEHVELGLAEHVDEARRDDQPGGVDGLERRTPGQLADGSDAIARDRDVALEPRRAGAVDDAAARDQDVERRGRLLGTKPGEPDGQGGDQDQQYGKHRPRGWSRHGGDATRPERGGKLRGAGK